MPAVASRRTGASTEQQTRSDRVRLRRSAALLLMTLVLPGSAQLLAGDKRWGWFALRVVGTLLLALFALVVVLKFWPSTVSALLFDPWVLGALRLGMVLLALGWAALLVDAWRIGCPLGLRRRHRFAVFTLSSLLCVAASGTLLFGAHLVGVHRGLVVDMFGSGTVSATEGGRYNVLLLGGDAGRSREGLRPDSITVASIDEDTGRTVLFGLPRNLEDVPFPDDSPLQDEFPDGFDCDGCYLNSVYTWADDAAQRDGDLFPDDVDDVGAYATKQAVEATTGLKVNYYVMVDMRGFKELVDAVGGVTVTVSERLPIGGVAGPVKGWIEPGRRHLDGYRTLWFARSRATTDDYSRMARQKCVMGAMLAQLDPRTVFTRFQDIAAAGKQMVTTDIPAEELSTFLQLAGKARRLPVSTVSFVPPKIETYDPDYDAIEQMVDTAIDKAEAADDRSHGGPAPVREVRSVRTSGGATAEAARPYAANDTPALAGSC